MSFRSAGTLERSHKEGESERLRMEEVSLPVARDTQVSLYADYQPSGIFRPEIWHIILITVYSSVALSKGGGGEEFRSNVQSASGVIDRHVGHTRHGGSDRVPR